jgi:hypothetical protein
MGMLGRLVGMLMVVLPLAGCPEVGRGPRVVPYDPGWFYVRHAPWIDGEATVAALAVEECRALAALPVLTNELQVYPFDLRYAVYRCKRTDDSGGTPAAGD